MEKRCENISLFECEVRYKVYDKNSLYGKFKKLGGKIIYPYFETDYYYIPKDKIWDPMKQNLRIRKWDDNKFPTSIYFSKFEFVEQEKLLFKKSIYEEGKIKLYEGNYENCKNILDDLGYKPWISIHKAGDFWEFPKFDFTTAVEAIDNLGIYGELEVMEETSSFAKKELEKQMKLFDIKMEEIDFRPLSVIYNDKVSS